MRNGILLIHKHWKAEKQVGHPEQDTYGHIALGWESVRASRQGSGLVCIWLVNLLGMAKRQRGMILEVLTQYLNETYLHYNVFQVRSKPIILIMRNPWHVFQWTRQCIFVEWPKTLRHRVCFAIFPHFLLAMDLFPKETPMCCDLVIVLHHYWTKAYALDRHVTTA